MPKYRVISRFRDRARERYVDPGQDCPDLDAHTAARLVAARCIELVDEPPPAPPETPETSETLTPSETPPAPPAPDATPPKATTTASAAKPSRGRRGRGAARSGE